MLYKIFIILMGYIVAAGFSSSVSLDLTMTAWGNAMTYVSWAAGMFAVWAFVFCFGISLLLLVRWLETPEERTLRELRERLDRVARK
jgi:hypothetical protein